MRPDILDRIARASRFEAARQALLAALADWLLAHPPADEVAEEVEATASAMRQLLDLYRHDDVDGSA